MYDITNLQIHITSYHFTERTLKHNSNFNHHRPIPSTRGPPNTDQIHLNDSSVARDQWGASCGNPKELRPLFAICHPRHATSDAQLVLSWQRRPGNTLFPARATYYTTHNDQGIYIPLNCVWRGFVLEIKSYIYGVKIGVKEL